MTGVPLHAQLINVLAALLLLLAFAMLAQRRVLTLINLFAAQGLALAVSTGIVAYATAQPHLYWSAGLTLGAQGRRAAVAAPPAHPQARRPLGVREPDQHPDDDADRHRARRLLVQPGAADRAARQHGDARDAGHRAGQRHAVVPDDDHAAQGDSAGDRLPVDGERPVLRGDQRDLRHADGRRARHRTRRAGRDAHPRRVLLPDPRAVRQPRPAAHGEAEGGE